MCWRAERQTKKKTRWHPVHDTFPTDTRYTKVEEIWDQVYVQIKYFITSSDISLPQLHSLLVNEFCSKAVDPIHISVKSNFVQLITVFKPVLLHFIQDDMLQQTNQNEFGFKFKEEMLV